MRTLTYAMIAVAIVILSPPALAEGHSIYMTYVGGASFMDPTGTIVGGAVVCDPTIGGGCPALVVEAGDILVVNPQDNMFGARIPLAICIDSAFDGVCRPEHPDDSIYFTCGNLSIFYDGPPGALAVFVMTADVTPDLGLCMATEGVIRLDYYGQGIGYEPPPVYLH